MNGIFKCEGCCQTFCYKHTAEHRFLLSGQLEDIIHEHENVYHLFYETKQQSPLLHEHVNRWEKESVTKIKQLAQEMREQINQLSQLQRQNTKEKFNQISKELEKARGTYEYLERDLNRWRIQLEQLQYDIISLPPTTVIHEEQNSSLINTISLSKIDQEFTLNDSLTTNSEHIEFDDNHHIAMHCGPYRTPSYVIGTQEYLSGKHLIRLFISKKTSDFILSFNIMPKLMDTPYHSSEWSTYGWQSDDCVNPPRSSSTTEKYLPDLKNQTKFHIGLLLDCDNHQLSYFNEITKRRREIDIDVAKCPLPWKLHFYLYDIGCLQVFCRKHLNEHRDALSHQLDEIVLEHDTLQQTICENIKATEKQHPVLKQIDQWEQEAIQKIQRLTEELRRQVKQLTDTQRVSKKLHELAERLQIARIDDDYVETDLNTWKTMLQELQNDLTAFTPLLSIHEHPSQILVSKVALSIPKDRVKQEKFGKPYGSVRIEGNNLIAVHCGTKNGTALVRGVGEYSSGIHKIRFLFKKSDIDYITSFGIVSKLMSLDLKTSDSSYKCYGWNSNDSTCAPGADQLQCKNLQDMIGQALFEIELTLDCDNRRISYINQRTQNRRELNIDITKCPFPWQVHFYLYEIGDCVRLLPIA
ncbi:unnamed protein product [Adineta ricciae]|uniref:SPRY domain-containing protein n=1 Tax=Adineta ricciae TaxID=249248 RepID=A0A814WG24_ADIRI|nr:unnamed protein product [Adineta ricciae]